MKSRFASASVALAPAERGLAERLTTLGATMKAASMVLVMATAPIASGQGECADRLQPPAMHPKTAT